VKLARYLSEKTKIRYKKPGIFRSSLRWREGGLDDRRYFTIFGQGAVIKKDKRLSFEIFRLAVPAILENLSHTMMMVVDAIIIAVLGKIYLAAIAVAGVMIWRIFTTPGCIYAGSVAMVARYYGAREFERVRITAGQSLLLAFVIGIGVTILGLTSSYRIMLLMGAEEAVAVAGGKYMTIILAAGMFRMIHIIGSGCLRAAGDTKTPMFVMVITNLLNVLLTYLLVFGVGFFPKMGIEGAALGSAISMAVGGTLVVVVLFTPQSRIQINLSHVIKVNFEYIRKIIQISIPNGVEEIIRTAGVLAFVKMIAAIGTVALAAHTIAIRIESISFMIGFGFAIAATTLVGQSLGMKDMHLARQSFKYTTLYALGIMSTLGVCFFLFPGFFVGLFSPDPEVRDLGIFCLRVVAVEQPLLATAMTLSGGIRGAGDTISPMITGLVGIVGIRIILCYILAFPLGMGFKGIYYGMVLDWVFRTIVIAYLYTRGRWTRIKL
jgi:putative MATE family efflux protein